MRIANLLLSGALLMSMALPALADPNPTNIPGHPRVNEVNSRVKNQHAQIKNGVQSGKLTPAQAAKLHNGRAAIKAQEHAMRKADNGHLTKGDKRQLNKELNHREANIKKDEARTTGK